MKALEETTERSMPASGRRAEAGPRGVARRVARLALGVALAALCAACGGEQTADPGAAELKSDLRAEGDAYANRSLDALAHDSGALALGEQLFDAYCAGCHGADGRGGKGVTDLTRGHFNYGDSADAIRATIRDGRHSEMPSLGREYGEVEIGQLVAYVRSLPENGALSDYEERGRAMFAERCAACHGDDGRGRPELGAPDLADDYWQHGDSMMNIRLVITRGATADCPPHGDELTDTEIDLLTAYLLHWLGS